ncbi:hypothetical protein F4861DRAFT_94940 [Xylaria intraflava]|nr:hypothetical protein F4861DRAFT_94940 [Xylaria intraflava]
MIMSSSPSALDALLDGPALAPPPGVVPQLDNPPSMHVTGLVVPIVTLVISTLTVAIRMYTQTRIIRKVTISDYTIFVAWGLFVGYETLVILSGFYTSGDHQWNVRLKNLAPFLYYVHVASVIYGACTPLIKISILTQYIQLFMPTGKPTGMYWTTVFLIVANVLYYFITDIIEIFACRPIDKVWNPFITEGWCLNVLALNVAASSINSVSDLSILVVPQFFIWRLNMSFRRKAEVAFLFFLAVIACISAIIRLAYTVELYVNQADLTYYTWYAGIWTLPEMAGGIVVACLPVTRIFYQEVSQSKAASSISLALTKVAFWSRSDTERGSKTGEGLFSEISEHDPRNNSQRGRDRGPAWAREYGVATQLFSQTDSESVTALQTGEYHEANISEDTNRRFELGSHADAEQSVHPTESRAHSCRQSIELATMNSAV